MMGKGNLKSPVLVRVKLFKREQEFIQLHGRRTDKRRKSKPRVNNYLGSKVFAEPGCVILLIEKNRCFRTQKRCYHLLSRFYQETYVCICKWHDLWNQKKKRKKRKKQFCPHSTHLYFIFIKRNTFRAQTWPNISAGHSTKRFMRY